MLFLLAAACLGLSGCVWSQYTDPAGGPEQISFSHNEILLDGDTRPIGPPDTDDPEYNVRAGDIYSKYVIPGLEAGRSGDWDKDIADQTFALKRDPNMDAAHLMRGVAYIHAGRSDDAIADLTDVIQKGPADGHAPGMLEAVYLARSEAYAIKRLYRQAAADDSQIIARDPTMGSSWNDRCWSRAILGDLVGALADCNRALVLSPGQPDFLDSRGFVYLKMKNYPAAILDYQAALRHERTASSLYGLGRAKNALGEAGGDAAIAAARRIDPKIAADFGT